MRPRLFLLALLTACAGRAEPETSGFSTEHTVTAVVLENVTACTVDAICGVRLEFADTTVFALYGLGEQDTTDCSISVETSDRAFGLRTGDVATLRLKECEAEGLVIDGFAAPPPTP